MSPNSNSNINQPINDGTRARTNTVASVTASSTIGSIASPDPSTPNLQRDGEVAEYTPAGQDDIATPPTQPFSRLSISARRTLDLVDRVGNTDEPKVPHQLAASAQIESGDTLSSPPSVVTHGSLGEDDHTEAVERSPDSDPFEYDDNASTQSSVEHHESGNSSNQVDDCNDTNVAQQLPTSDESYSDGISPINPHTVDQEETVYSNAVQQSTISDGPESPVQPSSTSERSESDGSITADSATVDTTPTPALTPPSPTEFSLNQFNPIVQALADLSPPSTFDGDIVVPVGQDLKLYICEKGYDASFKHEEDDEDGEVPEIDGSKE